MLSTDQKGAVAEIAIALAATKLGIDVYRPLHEGGRYDLILDVGGSLNRVQCKWAPRHGDVVIVRQQDTAEPGDIVVALLGDEATVKRLRKKGRTFVLEAANPAYAPIPLTRSAASPRILGKVVGFYRGLNSKR